MRYAAHRLVLKPDPEAAQRRKEAARREAHVRPFRESSGNAGMVAREMSSAEVLASWQHIEQRVLDVHTVGVPGTLRELRVRAYIGLIQERDSRSAPVTPDDTSQPGAPQDDGNGADGTMAAAPVAAVVPAAPAAAAPAGPTAAPLAARAVAAARVGSARPPGPASPRR